MKKIGLVIAMAFMVSITFGQKVNFSGEWKLNAEKSELGAQFSIAPDNIVVKHTRKTIEVEKHGQMQGQEYTTNDLFTLDGKACENPGIGNSVKKSTAVWNKKTKVLTIASVIPLDDGSDVELIEELAMEEDNLVIGTSAASAYGEMFEKYVFDKE